MALTGLLIYTPTLKRQIELAEQEGPDSSAYQETAQRGTIVGAVLAVLAMVIVFLMVIKPPLWA